MTSTCVTSAARCASEPRPRGTYFLDRAREWRAVADLLRARGVSDDDPVLAVWREAAWCHLLFTRARHDLIVERLSVVFCELSGAPTAPAPRGLRPAELLACAIDLFDWLRAVVSVRDPDAFRRLAA